MTLVDEVRAFNKFYTREIGLLDKHLPESDLSLPEARVLYELANAEGTAERPPTSAAGSGWIRPI